MSLKKTAKHDSPHAIFVNMISGWEWRVLKVYQTPERERINDYARWFCAVSSPFTHGSYDLGDTYKRDVLGGGILAACSPEFAEAYNVPPGRQRSIAEYIAASGGD